MTKIEESFTHSGARIRHPSPDIWRVDSLSYGPTDAVIVERRGERYIGYMKNDGSVFWKEILVDVSSPVSALDYLLRRYHKDVPGMNFGEDRLERKLALVRGKYRGRHISPLSMWLPACASVCLLILLVRLIAGAH